MAEPACPHANTARGVVQWDVARKGENSLYSINVSLSICPACGWTELLCDSPRLVCDWLTGKSPKAAEPNSGKPNGADSSNRRRGQ